MKTDKFIGTFTGTKSTCKLSDLQNSKEIYYRIFFRSGIMGLAHSYADSINHPDPSNLAIFLAENIRILACVPTISNYSNEEQKQLIQIESNSELRQAFINSLVTKFKPIFAGEKMMQDFWAEEEIKSQLLKRMDTHPTDTPEDIDLFTNGLDIEYCPPAIYEDLFRYMGEQIDKASTDFRNNELGCLQFINRVVTLMFKDSFMDVNYCKKISVYLFRDLLINYPSTNFPGKTVTQVKGSDLSAAVIKENTEKVDDSYLDGELQEVIQQQKIRQQSASQVAKFEIPDKTYIRKNGTVCKMVFCGAYALGELYPANLNQGKRVAGKYMTIPFKATKNTITKLSSLPGKIVAVKEGTKTLYRYMNENFVEFCDFCETNFDMIKEPRAMWEVK